MDEGVRVNYTKSTSNPTQLRWGRDPHQSTESG